jgi:hypothetical protein
MRWVQLQREIIVIKKGVQRVETEVQEVNIMLRALLDKIQDEV